MYEVAVRDARSPKHAANEVGEGLEDAARSLTGCIEHGGGYLNARGENVTRRIGPYIKTKDP